ncbi:MAG: alpha/beta fold hydrolase [Legionellaceae bacterium]|nr:alpha/beta fold hydrolase [Legionellaceae bacterium]
MPNIVKNRSSSLINFNLNPKANSRLFCFHWAGGNANAFKAWHRFLPSSVEVWAIQLPGRMHLASLEPYTDMHALVDRLYKDLMPYLIDKPFSFFGHSLGGLIGFELAHYIQERQVITPIKIIASACMAPNNTQRPSSTPLTENEIFEKLRASNGTPSDILNDKELFSMFLPIMKADFSLYQNYYYKSGRQLDCPITVFGGRDDDISEKGLFDWHMETTKPCVLQMISGGHFFIHQSPDEFFPKLSNELTLGVQP